MTTLKLGSSNNWLPTLLISLALVVGTYFYKDHQLNKAIEQYELQQAFLKKEAAKFGVIDSQFELMLKGRSVTLQDIAAAQTRVDSLVTLVDSMNEATPTKAESVKLEEALTILGL